MIYCPASTPARVNEDEVYFICHLDSSCTCSKQIRVHDNKEPLCDRQPLDNAIVADREYVESALRFLDALSSNEKCGQWPVIYNDKTMELLPFVEAWKLCRYEAYPNIETAIIREHSK